MRQFVEDANFRQRKLALQQMLVQRAHVARIEAIEAANDLRAPFETSGHGSSSFRPFSCLKQIITCLWQ